MESYRAFFLAQITNRCTDISDIEDKQQRLHKKAGVCYACAQLRIVLVLQQIYKWQHLA